MKINLEVIKDAIAVGVVGMVCLFFGLLLLSMIILAWKQILFLGLLCGGICLALWSVLRAEGVVEDWRFERRIRKEKKRRN